MTYKLGDRVVILKDSLVSTEPSNVGKRGTITAINRDGDFMGVSLDNSDMRIWYESDEIKLDKNYIVQQIINDL